MNYLYIPYILSFLLSYEYFSYWFIRALYILRKQGHSCFLCYAYFFKYCILKKKSHR